MAINVEWRDEGGAVLGRLERAVYDWRVAHQISPEDSHCLQYIDPVGDAYFNQQQRPRLIRELERALAKLEHSPLRRDAEAVLAFVRQCEGTHTYIVFVGD